MNVLIKTLIIYITLTVIYSVAQQFQYTMCYRNIFVRYLFQDSVMCTQLRTLTSCVETFMFQKVTKDISVYDMFTIK
jgi:hypothetical protein